MFLFLVVTVSSFSCLLLLTFCYDWSSAYLHRATMIGTLVLEGLDSRQTQCIVTSPFKSLVSTVVSSINCKPWFKNRLGESKAQE